MTTIHGVSLHYYDEAANSDKFYRAFIWPDGGFWFANFHWGRDGQNGMSKAKPDFYRTRERAEHAIEKKVQSKLAEGYQFLGQGDIDISNIELSDTTKIGDLLHSRVGREPTKLPNGFQLVIKELETVEDLIS